MKSFQRSKNSANLTQCIHDISERFEFDGAEVYHLTHHNIHQYKHIIFSGMDTLLRNMYGGLGPKEKTDSIAKQLNEFYDGDVMNALPISLIVFSHKYASSSERSLLFFEEADSLILFDNELSTLKLGENHFMLNRLNVDRNYVIHPKVQSTAYESSTTYGTFQLVSFLLPFNNESNLIDFSKHDSVHRKLELQVRTLRPNKDRNQKLNIPTDAQLRYVDLSSTYVFNTRLIYNDEIIFNEYDIDLGFAHDLIIKYLTPFIYDIEKKYEVISDMKLAPTKEYYDYFKANHATVVEMVKI